MNIMWFRSDLRVSDNPAFSAAMRQGPVTAVYLLCEQQWDEHNVALIKRDLIVRQLKSLERSLAALNVPLIVWNAGDFRHAERHLPAEIHNLTGGQCRGVYFNEEYEVNEAALSQNVVSGLQKLGIHSFRFHDQCAIVPGDIRTGSREYYKVFTPFKKAYIRDFHAKSRALIPEPEATGVSGISSDLSVLDSVRTDDRVSDLWPAGEDEAHDRLNRFIEDKINDYNDERDIPSVSGTSVLSPYLAIGAISTRQCLHAAMANNEGMLASGKEGADRWISELIWRDFYRHLLVAFPRLCRGKPFVADTDALPWKSDESLLTAWKEGRTGYPIVDAAMRQLNETGWMHNRLRMVAAMFLTKHLFIDWRLGENYFMEHLIDADFASNNGGWQWSASTGVDAVPYFRIFNPVRQSERFDPQGTFIRQYVPELTSLDKKAIHNPGQKLADYLGYPAPLVDHKQATESTKLIFRKLMSRSVSESTARHNGQDKVA